MARARNIKPAFFYNEELGDIEPLARLLFIGLWTISDCNGNIEWRPKRIKTQLLPYDNCDINELANNLDNSGFIRFYSIQEKCYLNIVNFMKHQNPHKNERDKGSDIPKYEKCYAVGCMNTGNPDKNGTAPDKNASDPADSLIPYPDSPILIPDIKHFDQQAEHEVKKIDSNAILENLFDQFWNSGIRKAGKKNARTVFRKILSGKVQKQEFTDYLIRDIQFRLTNEQQGFDLLHPTTYLRGERWTDEKLTRSDKPNNSGNGGGLDFLDDNDTGWAEEICREYGIEYGSSADDRSAQQEFENVVSVQASMEELSEQESRVISQGIPKPVTQGDD